MNRHKLNAPEPKRYAYRGYLVSDCTPHFWHVEKDGHTIARCNSEDQARKAIDYLTNTEI